MRQLIGFDPQTKILERRLEAPLACRERNPDRCEASSNIRGIQRFADGDSGPCTAV